MDKQTLAISFGKEKEKGGEERGKWGKEKGERKKEEVIAEKV